MNRAHGNHFCCSKRLVVFRLFARDLECYCHQVIISAMSNKRITNHRAEADVEKIPLAWNSYDGEPDSGLDYPLDSSGQIFLVAVYHRTADLFGRCRPVATIKSAGNRKSSGRLRQLDQKV
jgi:hypothetical protein